ncbi:MAG: coxL [Frankiales bacterium]|nr:coxL [Frankiales bacterium]
MSILGTRVVRNEDPELLTKGGTYTDDLIDERLDGAAHLIFVRSPVAHARILSIDTSEALKLPGVVAVYTAADVDLPIINPPMPMFNQDMTQTPLASDKVRYVGEPVAIVVCDDPYIREDAAELVEVEYDILPAVIGMPNAAKDEVLLWESVGTNTVVDFGTPDDLDPNLFDDCEVVVSHLIQNQRIHPAPMESRSGAASWPEGERLTAWIPSQGAQGAKAALAAQLGIDAAEVHVLTPDVGGAFGARFGADVEMVLTAWVAGKLHRPMRWSETRYENLLAMTHGRAQEQRVTIGGSRDGNMKKYRLEVLADCGAYPKIGGILPSLTRLMTPGTYVFDKAESIAKAVVTNTTPIGAYRGAGRPEATAAIERAVDIFAAEIGMDPADVRRKNLVPKFTEPHLTAFGALYDSGDYETALNKALEAANYEDLRKEQQLRRERGDAKQLGIGMSSYVEITGAGSESGDPNENATVEVHPDGTVTILTGTSPHGQGHATAWAMMASDTLGIGIDKITVIHGDTDLIPKGGGTGGSRSLQQGGMAVQKASIELVDIARTRAAELLEANEADLQFNIDDSGFSVAGVPSSTVTLAKLAEKERLFINAVFAAPGATFPFGAHLAVVEVDVETGKATLERIFCVDDAGVVMNPLLFDGQRHGGIAQGAAQAFLEEFIYDEDGNPLTASFADYPFLSATEVPSFDLVSMVTPTTYNPMGVKGVGEAGTIGATPAVQNAVVDAVSHLGVRHIDMPTSPRVVWEAIEAARSNSNSNGKVA